MAGGRPPPSVGDHKAGEPRTRATLVALRFEERRRRVARAAERRAPAAAAVAPQLNGHRRVETAERRQAEIVALPLDEQLHCASAARLQLARAEAVRRADRATIDESPAARPPTQAGRRA